jgi:putative chitinase
LSVKLTLEQTRSILKTNKETAEWHALLVDMLPRYEIDSVPRIAGFMAQCAHESADFTALEENLNYSEKALNAVFGRYFGPGKRNAAEYARQPEKIANYVYMDEFRSKSGALGNTQPGDGWRFRGGGIKQLTGRNNFTAFAKGIGKTPEEAADYVRTKQGALESACWFWSTNKLNTFADAHDIVGMSRRINGGDIGLEDRTARWNAALKILSSNTPTTVQPVVTPITISTTTLRRGSKGPEVQRMQQALKITADGVFGPGTESALKSWQKSNGLTADGIAGPATFRVLYA